MTYFVAYLYVPAFKVETIFEVFLLTLDPVTEVSLI